MKEELRQLVGENRLKEAIQKLVGISEKVDDINLRDDIIILVSRFRQFDRDRHRGVLVQGETQREAEEIKKALLAVADRLPAQRTTTVRTNMLRLLAVIIVLGGAYVCLMPGSINATALFRGVASGENDCIQPFIDNEKFSILILPFSVGGDNASASNLASDLLLRLEQISEEEEVDFSLHYWKEFSSSESLTRAEARSIIICTDADLLIYGGFWSSTKTDQGQLRIEFEMDEEVRESLDLFGEQLRFLMSGQSTPFFAPVAEIEEQFFKGELNDIARLEQLFYWLASFSKIIDEDYTAAKQLADKAWAYDYANHELLIWKFLLQYFDDDYTGIIAEAGLLPDSLQIDEVVYFYQLSCFTEARADMLQDNLQKELAQNPESFKTRHAASLLLGLFLNSGNTEEALGTIAICEEAMSFLPEELYWYKIKLLYQQSEMQMSPHLEKVLQARLEKEDDSCATHMFLAEHYILREEYDQALTAYEVLLAEIDVDSAYYSLVNETSEVEGTWFWEIATSPIYNAVGNVHFFLDNNVEAKKYYNLALKYADEESILPYRLNLTMLELRDKTQLSASARDSIEQFLLKTTKADDPAVASSAHLQVASLYEYQRDFSAAIWHAEEAMCEGANLMDATPILAFSTGQLGNKEESYEIWRDFLEMDSTSLENYLKVGVSLGQSGSHGYAAEVLEEGMERALAQNDTSAYSDFLPVVGLQYILQDSLVATIGAFDKLLALNPEVGEYAVAEILFGGILGMMDLSYAVLSEYSIGSRRVYFDQQMDEIGGQLGAYLEFFLCLAPPEEVALQMQEDEDIAAFVILGQANSLICRGELEEGKKMLDDYLITYPYTNEMLDMLTAYVHGSYYYAKEDTGKALAFLDNAILQARNLPRLSLEELASLLEGVPLDRYLLTMVYNHLYYAKMQVQAANEDYEAVYETALAAERDGVKNVHVRTTYLTLKEEYE